ncbi:MAG TPA: DedA family protein [Negativicutes bacterium]|nr:DedA family protein [Negativicutes bacterium]
MDIIKNVIDVFLHLDDYLNVIIQSYGLLTYLILFIIIFAETGLVVMPFLPGDSLLFATGAFAAAGALDIKLLLATLSIAALLGDTVNYTMGKFVGKKIYEQETVKFIKKEHLLKTHRFYEKHGAVTIIIARFIPIIRTFAPFVAGIGEMRYLKFMSYNISGGLLWVFLFVAGGYFFGNLPVVKNNFSLFIMAVILISVMPVIIGFFRESSKVEEEN